MNNNSEIAIALLQSKSVQYMTAAVCIIIVVIFLSKHFGVGKKEVKTVIAEVKAKPSTTAAVEEE